MKHDFEHKEIISQISQVLHGGCSAFLGNCFPLFSTLLILVKDQIERCFIL